LLVILDLALQDGNRELTIDGAFTLSEAAALVLQIPPVSDPEGLTPTGWGVFPPSDFGPSIQVRPGVRDQLGRPVPRDRHGIVCCMWRTARRPDRIVHRLSFPGDAATPAIHPVDVYDDQIARELALRVQGAQPIPFAHPGWALCRLEPAPEDVIAAREKQRIDRALGRA
jgi:hypothetical protein